MTSRDLLLENKRLKQQLAEARAAIADRDAKIEKLARDLAKLEALVTQLLAQRRGDQSVPEVQGLLFPKSTLAIEPPKTEGIATDESDAADEDNGDEADGRRSPPSKSSGKRTPRKIDTTGLPREDRLHDVPEAQRVDPITGQQLVQIGEQVFEELDFIRAQVTVICHRRPVYGLPPAEAEHREIAPMMADLPPRPLENCGASASLLAWLLVQKFANHLPLYRQEQIFGRDGKRLPRQALCDLQLASAEQLLPIVECLFGRIRAGPCIQLDDTPMMCQGGRSEPHFQACLWTFVNPEVDGVVYRFTPGRASEPLATEIGGFSGTLVGDGYSGNRAAANKSTGEIAIAGCWAHGNRKFRDAEKEAPGTARLFRNDIKKLYEIEREADEAGLDAAARAVLRQQKARPILADLFDLAQRQAKMWAANVAGHAQYGLAKLIDIEVR